MSLALTQGPSKVAVSMSFMGLAGPFVIIPTLPAMMEEVCLASLSLHPPSPGPFQSIMSNEGSPILTQFHPQIPSQQSRKQSEHDINLISSFFTTASAVGSVTGPILEANLVAFLGFDGLLFGFSVCLGIFTVVQTLLLVPMVWDQKRKAGGDHLRIPDPDY